MTAKTRALHGLSGLILAVWAFLGVSHECLFAASWTPSPGKSMNVGYLGDSLSYVDGAMPNQVQSLAAVSNGAVGLNGNAPSGWSLASHAASPVSLAVVSNTNLNVVVIQQASAGTVDAASLQTLANPVTAHGGEVLLYETWGYSTTWQTDIPQIRQNYLTMAADVTGGATIAPVGLAWYQVLTANSGITLFADSRHPTLEGAYLTGCVIYASIFGRSPVGNSYTGSFSGVSLSATTAAYLQTVAAQTVMANPWATDPWGYGTNNFPWAFDWNNYSSYCGSTLPGIVISGGGGQPAPSVRVNTNDGQVNNLYLGAYDPFYVAGQGSLYVFDGGSLTVKNLVVANMGQGYVQQSGGNLSVTGTLTMGAGTGSYGTYNLSGDGVLNAQGATIDIRNGVFDLMGGTFQFGTLLVEPNGSYVDSSTSNVILSGSLSAVSSTSGTVTINSFISGTGSLLKTGAGTAVLTNNNSYTGSTIINGGTLIVSGAILGSSTLVNFGGTLMGSGTLGLLQIAKGAIVSPGQGLGTLTAGNTIFQPGGKVSVELANATGIPGTGWSDLVVNGSLNLSGLNPKQPFTFSLDTMGDSGTPGLWSNFSGGTSYDWPVAYFTSIVGSFSSNEFVVDTSLFANAHPGTFSIALNPVTDSLDLIYVPEPKISLMLAGGAFGLLAAGRRWKIKSPT